MERYQMVVGREVRPALFRPISGTYKNIWPADDKIVLELRVDVDGRRPQQRVSGDIFRQEVPYVTTQQEMPYAMDVVLPIWVVYKYSFVVENVVQTYQDGAAVLRGSIKYYQDLAIIDETIEVRIPRVLSSYGNIVRRVEEFYTTQEYFSSGNKDPDAVINFYKHGNLMKTYVCPKRSDYFRRVTLEIDCFQETDFPPRVNMDIDPSPADIPARNVTVKDCFRRAGIDMKVREDDVLNDPDSADPGNNWGVVELNDLMEDRFDRFADRLQWNVYGVVVPRFGDPDYDSSFYGVMFDWGGREGGDEDTYFRQGSAVALQAIRSHSADSLYDTDPQRDRLFLQTFIHEIGHNFNLPHTWQRTILPDPASQSFMNYPWLFTDGTGGEGQFWENFYWEFDDVELVWMRHGDRNDVIFGGNDWIGNNLSIYVEPQADIRNIPLRLSLSASPVVDFAEPVRLEVKLTNVSNAPQIVTERLEPEDYLITLYIRRPNGDFVRYVPPLRRLKSPGNLVKLAPGESIQASVLVSFGARGHQFQEPGEYRVRAYYGRTKEAAIISKALRLRVAAPTSRQDEELAYLLFDRNVAKFLYFSGTERYPEVTSRLEEAVREYAKTNPRVVRHISAALGIHARRNFKRVETKKGKRVVVARKPKLGEAIAHLQLATDALSYTKQPAVDDVRYANLAYRLAECQVSAGKKEEAKKTLDLSVNYLKKHKVGKRLIDYLETRREALSKKGRGEETI